MEPDLLYAGCKRYPMIYPVDMEELDAARSDEEILAQSVAEPAVFALLVRKYEQPFLRKALSIIRDEEDAQDIVQETFTKIYLYAHRFKKQEGAQFSSWGYRILINVALSHYQKQKRRTPHAIVLEEELWQLIPDREERQFEKQELSDVVASILSRMSPLFSRVLTLFFLEGKSQEEMAQLEGVSVGAIKTRVHRAKHEFRKIYQSVTRSI